MSRQCKLLDHVSSESPPQNHFCVNLEAFISELLSYTARVYESTDESFVLKAAKCISHTVRRNESEAIEDSRWAGCELEKSSRCLRQVIAKSRSLHRKLP